jgi:NAD(P)-dependent dehydrogenase (short-subunit alcohol dehydrogenase family)
VSPARRRPTALVTGASRGIGRAIALALADRGHDVAITARTVVEGSGPDGLPGSLQTTAAEIAARGGAALPVPLDLLEPAALGPAVERVLGAWGRIDVLVNNAIYVGPGGNDRFLSVDPAEIEKRVYGNLTAQLLLTQLVARAMVDAGGGTVVNVTSAAGMFDPRRPVGEGGWAVSYGCSKGGFHRMAGVLAAELGPAGLRFYNLEPGYVATERVLALSELSFVAERGVPPELVGAVAAWLLERPDGEIKNGATLHAQEYAEAAAAYFPAAAQPVPAGDSSSAGT